MDVIRKIGIGLFLLCFFACSNEEWATERASVDEFETIEIFSEEDMINNLKCINSEMKNLNKESYTEMGLDLGEVESDTLLRLRNANEIHTVSGYDKRKILKKYNLSIGFPFDIRVLQGVPYYTELCEYIKYIDVPVGYSVLLPPINTPMFRGLLSPLNMGYIPDSFTVGFSVRYVSRAGNKERYALFTQVEEIIKNTKNNQRLSPPVYNPSDVVNPSTFQFRYQLSNSVWD